MNYLTNYYKNLSEQLQERINLLEAKLNTPDQILNMDPKNLLGTRVYPDPRRRRAGERQDLITHLMSIAIDPDRRIRDEVDHHAVVRVLSDLIGVEAPSAAAKAGVELHGRPDASLNDLKHVMAYVRRDYYNTGNPRDEAMNAARQRTHERYDDLENIGTDAPPTPPAPPIPGFEQTMGDLNDLSIRPKQDTQQTRKPLS